MLTDMLLAGSGAWHSAGHSLTLSADPPELTLGEKGIWLILGLGQGKDTLSPGASCNS